MPIYVYECTKCHTEFQRLLQKFTETTTCPHCDGVAQKIPSVTNFSLKGDGFHKNDYPK